MKYRLKKDLPFAKAGVEVNYIPYDYNEQFGIEKDGYMFIAPIDEMAGWIEPVEPREWVIPLSIISSTWEQYLNIKVSPEDDKMIKVREVINE